VRNAIPEHEHAHVTPRPASVIDWNAALNSSTGTLEVFATN
jgi:hypothetical protein